MLYEMKSRRPGAKDISVVNQSEKTIYIGRTKLEPGVSTPVPVMAMIRKTSYVDRLWRNGVIELGATTDMVPEGKSEVAGSEEDTTPPAANKETEVSGNDSEGQDTSSAQANEDASKEETTVVTEDKEVEETPEPEVTEETKEDEVEETPEPEVTETVESAEETPVKTEEAPSEATPVQKPKARKA